MILKLSEITDDITDAVEEQIEEYDKFEVKIENGIITIYGKESLKNVDFTLSFTEEETKALLKCINN